jgi:hypothetical protein
MTPFTVCYVAAIRDGVTIYRVGWVLDGLTPVPTGPEFPGDPLGAVRYAERLER